jgi:hypothetical protein
MAKITALGYGEDYSIGATAKITVLPCGYYAVIYCTTNWAGCQDLKLSVRAYKSVENHRKSRSRVAFLGEKAARLAIQQSPRQAGATFSDAATTKLVDDLRQVRIQLLDGQ